MLESYLLHIIVGFLLSFIGSLPLGIINMTVVDTAIRKSLKAGIVLGAGAALIELIQSFIAIKFTHLFVENPAVDFWFNIVALVVFVSLGIYYFFFVKAEKPATEQEEGEKRMPPFFKGMLVSSLNVLVIPYWIFYGTYLSSNGWMNVELDFLISFCIGVMLGAFALFALYAKLGLYIINRAEYLMNWVNKFIAIVFFGFAAYQLWKLWGIWS